MRPDLRWTRLEARAWQPPIDQLGGHIRITPLSECEDLTQNVPWIFDRRPVLRSAFGALMKACTSPAAPSLKRVPPTFSFGVGTPFAGAKVL